MGAAHTSLSYIFTILHKIRHLVRHIDGILSKILSDFHENEFAVFTEQASCAIVSSNCYTIYKIV